MSQNKTLRKRLAPVGFCLLLFMGQFAPAQSPLSTPILLVPPVTIGKSGVAYRNPTIAVARAGSVTIVAETGPASSRRLVLSDLSPIGWGPAATLDFSGPGDCCNPSVTYDSSGALHLVWSEKQGAAYAIRYARRSPNGQWLDEGILSVTPELNCEFPQVATQHGGRTWAAWQAGRATRYGVYLAWRDGDSSFTVYDVTEDKNDHHNLYPQLFPDSPYLLVWYEETGTSFRPQSIVSFASETDFATVAPLEFNRLDANQMPWLFQAPSHMLGGIWTDLIGNRVRVFVGIQGAASQGEGLVADTTLSGDAAHPYAVAIGEESIALSWISRLPSGSAVYVGRLDGISRVGPSLVLPAPFDGSFSRPRLAAGGGNVVHCVWFSDATRGGTGSIYYAALRF